MPAIAQSVSWWCFVPERLTPNVFVRAVADADYIAVDLVPPEYFSLVADHGLKIAAIAGHGSLTVGLNKRDQHARIKKEIEAKIVNAVRYGIPNLICFSGNRDGLADNEGGEITAEELALLVPLAEREGITLIWELLNSKVGHPDYQADHTARGVCADVWRGRRHSHSRSGTPRTVESTGSRATARLRQALSRPRSGED